MPKTRTQFVCQQCGYTAPRWSGRCPECGQWNTLVETIEERPGPGVARAVTRTVPQPITAISADGFARIPVPIDEFNRAIGGGIVPGSVVLIGGDPGIGKSTLLLQLSALLASEGKTTLYISGEESVQQIKMRADRLNISVEQLYVLSETNLNHILSQIEQLEPQLVVVDSIQSVYLEELESSAGSIGQVRECAAALLRLAKSRNIPMFIVGHVTKEGAIAGPRVLEHMVDTVLYLEGDRFYAYRLLRSVKNRFGSTNEVGVFEMQEQGLVEITNPSQAFLSERLASSPGSVVAVTMEGTRPLLVEVQALTTTTSFGLPRRTANGIDFNRMLLLTAVLSKRVGLKLASQDIFVNVVGGLRISEPAADLAVAGAIASSYRNIPIPDDCVMLGEVGLSGELRSVSHAEKRLNEAAKLGFKRCIVPRFLRLGKAEAIGIELLRARSIGEALDIALQP
nr:DNA repair protein RadA [Chloroflexota bacterium]